MSLLVRSARFSIAISRALGTVVVTVHGDLDVVGARHLGSVLADIIDIQGNLAVVVDLHDATALDASGLSVFATAAALASRRGASLTLSNPPDVLYQALSLGGAGGLLNAARHDRRRPSPSAPFGRIAAPPGVGNAARPSAPGSTRRPTGARRDPAHGQEGQRQGDGHLQWMNDEDAYEPNEFGVDNSILDLRRDHVARTAR